MKKQWFFINENSDVPEMAIIGRIAQGDDVDYASFRNAFDKLAKPAGKVRLLINSGGGDMIQGFAIYDHLKESKAKIEVHVIGMAASMASVLTMAGDTIKMSKNAVLMIHRPSVLGYGESDSLRSAADIADKLEVKAKAIYKERTGKTDDVINSWMKPGVDKWFSADEAISNGLADSIIQDDRVKIAASLISNESDAWKFYNEIDANSLFKTQHTMNEEQLKALRIKLGMAANATIDDVLAEIDKQKTTATRVTQLENSITEKDKVIADLKKEANTKRNIDLVEGAIRDKKIPAGQKDFYITFAEKDYETAKKLIDEMPKATSISGKVDETDKNASEERAVLLKMSWTEIDQANKLKSLKKYPDLYKAKFKEQFGKEPNA